MEEERKTPAQLLEELEGFRREEGISKKDIARILDIPYETFQKWFQKGGRRPAPRYLERIREYVESSGEKIAVPSLLLKEADWKSKKIEFLLLLLEEELRWFKECREELRELLREELDFNDVGYITSLLTMLSDEERFQRWLALSSNRFRFFRRRGKEKKGGEK